MINKQREIEYFSKEDLEKKSTQRLLAIKKKLYPIKTYLLNERIYDGHELGGCNCDACKRAGLAYKKIQDQFDLIKSICATRENV